MYAKIDKILQSNSFIAFKLTGAVSQDLSQGYGLHCFDMRTGKWNEAMCEKLGIPVEFLPEIVPCDHVVGTVTKKKPQRNADLQRGLLLWQEVWMQPAELWGCGGDQSRRDSEQGGQAGGMSICLDEYKADPRLILGFHVVLLCKVKE